MRVILPDTFEGQPRIITAAILVWYVVVGPFVPEQLSIARPRFPWTAFILVSCSMVASVLLGTAASMLASKVLLFKLALFLIVTALSVSVFGALLRESYITLFISLYQRRAPSSVRLRCKQTPSCSEYMRTAIIKFGWIKGFNVGWKRLRNCTGQEGHDAP